MRFLLKGHSDTNGDGEVNVDELYNYVFSHVGQTVNVRTAKSKPRKIRVQVVIDEFQKMIADNLEVVLQQARGFDIGLVLAKQSLGDLKACGPVLLNAIEGNCAIRQWLSITTAEDLKNLALLFGTHKEIAETVNTSSIGQSVSQTVRDAPRITITDLHRVSSDPLPRVGSHHRHTD